MEITEYIHERLASLESMPDDEFHEGVLSKGISFELWNMTSAFKLDGDLSSGGHRQNLRAYGLLRD